MFLDLGKGVGAAATAQRQAFEAAVAEQRRQYDLVCPKPLRLVEQWDNVGDFWNDPRRWHGIDNPRKVMFWSIERPHVRRIETYA